MCVCVFRGTSTTPEVLHPLLMGGLGKACGAPCSVEHPLNTEARGLSLWRWALSLQLAGATCLHSTQFKTLHDCLLVVLPVSSAWPTVPCPWPCPPGPSAWLLMSNSLSFCPSVVPGPSWHEATIVTASPLAGIPPPTLPVPFTAQAYAPL